MDYTKRRWLILGACCTVNLCIGSMYAWSIFASPMADYLSGRTGTTLTAGALSIVFTLANSVGPITMIFGGRINDLLGPRWVIVAGGILFGGGMIGCGFASNVTGLLLWYGLGCGLGMGLAYGCTVSSCVKFFPDKRGLIGGLTTASYGFSSVLMPPVATRLIGTVGVTAAFRWMGAAFLVVIALCATLVSPCPTDFHPGQKITIQANTGETKELDWRGMLSSPVFYVMLLMLTCGAVSGLMVISQMSPIAQTVMGMTPSQASAAVSILALANVGGRVAAGWLSDQLGRVRTLRWAMALSICGLAALVWSGPELPGLFYLGIIMVGACFGAFMGIYPGFTADQFGQKNNSVNYGIMFIGFATAGAAGPSFMAQIFSRTGSYRGAFMMAVVLAALGLTLSCCIGRSVADRRGFHWTKDERLM